MISDEQLRAREPHLYPSLWELPSAYKKQYALAFEPKETSNQ